MVQIEPNSQSEFAIEISIQQETAKDKNKIFDLSCVEENFVLSLFSYEINEFTFFIYSFFQNVRKLSK